VEFRLGETPPLHPEADALSEVKGRRNEESPENRAKTKSRSRFKDENKY